MKQFVIWYFLVLAIFLQAGETSPAYEAKQYNIGYKVSVVFCDKTKLASIDLNHPKQEILSRLKGQYCQDMEDEYLEALYFYVTHPNYLKKHQKIKGFTHKDKCLVCGMFIYKYPTWATKMEFKNSKVLYFDGTKDMMKYYLYVDKYHYDRNSIQSMWVPDFYTFEKVDAKKAYYVIGSYVRGPMGNELIPFATLKEAQIFLSDHHGKEIVRFDNINPQLISKINRYVRH